MAFGDSEQPETDSPLSTIPDAQTQFSHRTLLALPRGTASGSHPEGLTPQVWVWLGVRIFSPSQLMLPHRQVSVPHPGNICFLKAVRPQPLQALFSF